MKEGLYLVTFFNALKEEYEVIELPAYSEQQARFLCPSDEVIDVERTVAKER